MVGRAPTSFDGLSKRTAHQSVPVNPGFPGFSLLFHCFTGMVRKSQEDA